MSDQKTGLNTAAPVAPLTPDEKHDDFHLEEAEVDARDSEQRVVVTEEDVGR